MTPTLAAHACLLQTYSEKNFSSAKQCCFWCVSLFLQERGEFAFILYVRNHLWKFEMNVTIALILDPSGSLNNCLIQVHTSLLTPWHPSEN